MVFENFSESLILQHCEQSELPHLLTQQFNTLWKNSLRSKFYKMILFCYSDTLVKVFISGLFHRVILMSGSLFAPWSRVRDPLNYALQLGRKFNCSIPTDLTNEHGKVVDCLRNVTAEKLMSAQLNVPSFHLDFGPSFDGVTIKNNFADIKGKRSFGTR